MLGLRGTGRRSGGGGLLVGWADALVDFAFRGNRVMKIVDLALRGSLPLEYRKSNMRVNALVW